VPEITAASVLAELRPLGTEAGRAALARFMKPPVPSLGLTSPQLKAMATRLYAEVKRWPAPRRNQLCNGLWLCGYHEGGTLAIYLYRRFVRQCGAAEFRLFERWVERCAMSWAHVDGVGCWLIAACLANDPTLAPALLEWTTAKGQWKRRAAAVSLIGEGKRGRQWELIRELAVRLGNDPEDLVRKGVGWLLKETYAGYPREVVTLLGSQRFPRHVLQYAAEKMTAADRARVLQG